jgi:hypothetical protein
MCEYIGLLWFKYSYKTPANSSKLQGFPLFAALADGSDGA